MRLALINEAQLRTIKDCLKYSNAPALSDAMQVLMSLEATMNAYEPHSVERARAEYQRDGEVEIDEGAVCSRGDDPGLYVQAWVWVYDE